VMEETSKCACVRACACVCGSVDNDDVTKLVGLQPVPGGPTSSLRPLPCTQLCIISAAAAAVVVVANCRQFLFFPFLPLKHDDAVVSLQKRIIKAYKIDDGPAPLVPGSTAARWGEN